MSGVRLSVGAEMEAYADQAAAASHQVCCKFRKVPNYLSMLDIARFRP